jgi:A/G-specific adenine glycosylase
LKKLIIKGMDKRYFSPKIVQWYGQNKRDLPWRDTNDPYKIWLSEIILQQTRVSQGLPYYERFIAAYPTIASLARASEQEILRLWQGLGYYSRARNLHKCAKEVSGGFGGVFPKTYESLKVLPGIGDYTAAAIASFAFKQPVAVVDGNVFRVLSRIYGIDTPINSLKGKKEFSDLANDLIGLKHPDLHNQAMMEFGATFCTPKNPSCEDCVFQNSCFAFQNDMQEQLPVKLKLKKTRNRYFHYLVFRKGKSLMMKKRGQKDIWEGLYDFPVIENAGEVNLKKILKSEPSLKSIEAKDIAVTDIYKHVLTHQTIYCRFVIVNFKNTTPGIEKAAKFYSMEKIKQLPKPVLVTRFLSDNAFYS